MQRTDRTKIHFLGSWLKIIRVFIIYLLPTPIKVYVYYSLSNNKFRWINKAQVAHYNLYYSLSFPTQ